MSSSTCSQDKPSTMQVGLPATLKRIEALEAQNHDLHAQIQHLQAQLLKAQTGPPPPPHDPFREPLISPPETFHGRDQTKLPPFLLSLDLTISGQPSRFPTDREKILFACSYLRDGAKYWVTPSARKLPPNQPAFMKNYELFVKELQNVFGDPDERGTASRRFYSLRQDGAVRTYFTEMRRLAAILDYDDATLYTNTRIGLKDSVRLYLPYEETGTLESLLPVATDIDNLLDQINLGSD